jgi:hypothetical protein
MSDAPAPSAADERRRRRMEKIKAGGSSRLNQITSSLYKDFTANNEQEREVTQPEEKTKAESFAESARKQPETTKPPKVDSSNKEPTKSEKAEKKEPETKKPGSSKKEPKKSEKPKKNKSEKKKTEMNEPVQFPSIHAAMESVEPAATATAPVPSNPHPLCTPKSLIVLMGAWMAFIYLIVVMAKDFAVPENDIDEEWLQNEFGGSEWQRAIVQWFMELWRAWQALVSRDAHARRIVAKMLSGFVWEEPSDDLVLLSRAVSA